jgi:hypothetical protein
MLANRIRFSLGTAALLTVLGVLPLSAAIPTGLTETPGAPTDSEATVVVCNHNSLDVVVYAVSEAGRGFRLGIVQRTSDQTLTLPEQLADGSTEFRLRIYSLRPSLAASATRGYLQAVKTNPLSARAGDKIMLYVMRPLAESFIAH